MSVPDSDPAALHPRTIGQLLDDAWRLALREAPQLYALISLFAVPAVIALLLLLTRPSPEGLWQQGVVPAMAALFLTLTGLGSGASQHLLQRRQNEKNVRLRSCLVAVLWQSPGHLLGRALTLLFTVPGVAVLILALRPPDETPGLVIAFVVLFGLFVLGIALFFCHAFHPILALGERPLFSALGTALSRELQRSSAKAAVAVACRIGLFLIVMINLQLLVEVLLLLGGALGGLETAILELAFSLNNPLHQMVLGIMAWFLLAPFGETINFLLHLDARVRHDGADLLRRIAAAFPTPERGRILFLVATLAAGFLASSAAAQQGGKAIRRSSLQAMRAELGQILRDVRESTPYPGGGVYLPRLEALAKQLETTIVGEAERVRWFRSGLSGFAGRSRDDAIEVLEELDQRLSLLEDALGPSLEGQGDQRRSREEIRSLIPGAEGMDGAQGIPPPAARQEDELRRPTVRREEPGEGGGPRGGGGRGVVAPQMGGSGFGTFAWMMVAGVFVAILVIAGVLLWRRNRGDSADAPQEHVPLPPQDSPLIEPERYSAAELWRRAESLARKGEFLDAIRLLYLAALTQLHEGHLIRYEATRTNNEYLSQLRAQDDATPLVEPFGRLTGLFERTWYGERRCAAEDYEVGHDLCAQLRASVREIT